MNKPSFLLFSTLVLAPFIQTQLVSATETSTMSSSAITSQPQNTSQPTTVLDPETLASASSPVTEHATVGMSDPRKPSQLLDIQQTNSTLRISYPRTNSQSTANIYYGIWSHANGQDDIKWYRAGQSQTEIPLSKLGTSGEYSVHAYITIDGVSTFLTGKTFSFQQTSPTLHSTVSPEGTLDITVNNLPPTTTEVLLPTWSEKNGQDDVKWYSLPRNNDGTATLRINLKHHNFEAGLYHTHFYIRESGGDKRFINSLKTTISANQLPTIQEPVLTISSLDAVRGTYQISIQEQTNTKPIKSVDVATWSTANQGNIKWRTASGSNGQYRTSVNFQEHQAHQGIYHNHVYITYTDGSRVGYIAKTVDLTKARLPVTVQTQYINPGNFTVQLQHVYGTAPVRYAVWSEEGGQDDIRWYEATKTGPTSYSGDIPLVVHSGAGTYHLHVYQENTGLAAHSFQVASHQKELPATSYPIGECTWGAKTLAPWAGDFWGNGGDWADSARQAGFKIGSTPKVGAIAVWSGANGYGGGYGHVAVVTDVHSTTSIRVKEANYARNRYIGDFRGWFNPVADGVTAYIYPY